MKNVTKIVAPTTLTKIAEIEIYPSDASDNDASCVDDEDPMAANVDCFNVWLS